jgi:transcriptional regulator with XRE-family HTH domain
MAASKRSELGDFLRSRREKLRPETVGLPAGRARRTPGLKREEVAQLAGISIDWYVRLEQGRTVSPSASTLEALARALRLDKVEQEHLRALARGPLQPAFSRETVPEVLRRMVERLETPAYITGRRWDLLAWNAAAVELLTDFGQLPESERNILAYVLTDPGARRLFGATWADVARRMVAQFRATHDLWAGDPAFIDLRERLRRTSPEFTRWWKTHDVRGVASGRKVLTHPDKGPLRFEHASFQSNDDPALKLVIYTPV